MKLKSKNTYRKQLNLTIPCGLVVVAKKQVISLSRFLERHLRQHLNQEQVVRPTGFEPVLQAWRA